MIDVEKLADECGAYIATEDQGETPFMTRGEMIFDAESLYNFAEAYAAKVLEDKEREIAEFKSQINELKSLLIDARDDVAAQLDAYQELLPYKQHRYDAQKNTLDEIDKALSKTPAQSLIEHDNEVIEKCANAVEDWQDLNEAPCEVIRALKGKP